MLIDCHPDTLVYGLNHYNALHLFSRSIARGLPTKAVYISHVGYPIYRTHIDFVWFVYFDGIVFFFFLSSFD